MIANQSEEKLILDFDDETPEVDEVIESEESETLAETEKVEEEEHQSEPETEMVEALEDLKVKFLKEEKSLKDIPRDELKELIQKGMNHDRVNEKLSKQSEKLTMLDKAEEIAGLYGFENVGKMFELMFDDYFKTQAEKDGGSAEVLRENYELKRGKRGQEDEFAKFVEKYPDITPEEIDEQTWEAFKSGTPLETAYAEQKKRAETDKLLNEINQLKTELKTLKQNESTKTKAVVKATQGGESDGDEEWWKD